MKLHRLDYRQTLPTTPEIAWEFFSAPGNLARITPPWLDFRVISDPPPDIYPGLLIIYRISPLPGITSNWISVITRVERPRCFVDEQSKGPYRLWRHRHDFEAVEGGVLMTDHVEYALPFGLFGNLAHRPIVRPRLEKIFAYRRKALEDIFGEHRGTEPDSTAEERRRT